MKLSVMEFVETNISMGNPQKQSGEKRKNNFPGRSFFYLCRAAFQRSPYREVFGKFWPKKPPLWVAHTYLYILNISDHYFLCTEGGHHFLGTYETGVTSITSSSEGHFTS